MKRERPIIGIIGGMGPRAGLYLHRKIVEYTPARSDQDHFAIIHYSAPFPDRTRALLYGGTSPLTELIKIAAILENLGACCIAIACSTAHAYISEIQQKIHIPIIDMIEKTLEYISNTYRNTTKIGLLATNGAIEKRVYHKLFESEGYKILTPSAKTQERIVMKAIYGKSGIKAGNMQEGVIRSLLNMCQELIKTGAEIVVMGCTDIASEIGEKESKVPLIDPIDILARAVIEYVTKQVQKRTKAG